MKVLDRYVVSSYLKNLLSAVIAATVVFLVVNLVERLDKFIDGAVPASVVIEYYYLYIPYIVYLILPVATLLATLFTIGRMTMSNELIAVYVSGIPFSRIITLILTIALLCSAGAFALGEFVVPAANRRRNDIYRYQVRKLPRETRVRHGRLYLQIAPDRQLYIDHYRPSTREAFGIEIIQLEGGCLSHRIDAEKMVWRDGSWFLQGVSERSFGADGSADLSFDHTKTLTSVGLEPDAFARIQTKPEEMNWRELRSFIDRLKRTGGVTTRWEVELLSKISLPAAAVIIVLFGAPIAAVKRRTGTAFGFGVSLFICFIYFGFIQVGKVMGINGSLHPVVAAWIGNIIFGLVGMSIIIRYRK